MQYCAMPASVNFKSEEMGRACSTAIEHTPHDRDSMGSIPASSWAFFLNGPSSCASLIKVPLVSEILLIFLS